MSEVTIRGKRIFYEGRHNFWQDCERNAWEPETFDILDRFLGPGKQFLDIGSWNGVCSIYAHALGAIPTAVEPDSVAISEASRNFELNGIAPPLWQVAITDKKGFVNLKNSIGGFGNSMSSVLNRYEDQDTEVVACCSLEDFLDNIGISPDLIKMDTEGAETLIIPSSVKSLKNCNCPLYLALHPYWYKDGDYERIIGALTEIYDMSKTEHLIHDQLLLFPKEPM